MSCKVHHCASTVGAGKLTSSLSREKQVHLLAVSSHRQPQSSRRSQATLSVKRRRRKAAHAPSRAAGVPARETHAPPVSRAWKRVSHPVTSGLHPVCSPPPCDRPCPLQSTYFNKFFSSVHCLLVQCTVYSRSSAFVYFSDKSSASVYFSGFYLQVQYLLQCTPVFIPVHYKATVCSLIRVLFLILLSSTSSTV